MARVLVSSGQAPVRRGAQGSITRLPSGSLRVRVYTGSHPLTGRPHYIGATVADGPLAQEQAEEACRWLLGQVRRRRLHSHATVNDLLNRHPRHGPRVKPRHAHGRHTSSPRSTSKVRILRAVIVPNSGQAPSVCNGRGLTCAQHTADITDRRVWCPFPAVAPCTCCAAVPRPHACSRRVLSNEAAATLAARPGRPFPAGRLSVRRQQPKLPQPQL